MALGFDWRGLDHYLNIEDMCEVLRDNGMSVQTANKCNSVGKNEVHFWMNRNGRTLHRVLYEYGLGSLEKIQRVRRYFIQDIIDTFDEAERADEKHVHIMCMAEMVTKLEERGFKAEPEYIPDKKVYRILVRKGDWHCVKEVDWSVFYPGDNASMIARQRQDTLDSIFEAYKKYERKIALNSLYGSRPLDLHPKAVWITTAGCGPDNPFEKMIKEKIKEKEMKDNEHTLSKESRDALVGYCALDVAMTKALHQKTNPHKLPEIEKVIFNNPATIVIWADDTKTIVKAQNGETFDPEKGLAMAITKKALGNEGRYFDTIKKYVPNNDANKKKEHSKEWLAYQSLQRALFDPKATKANLKTAMSLAVGYLNEVVE